VYSSGWNRKYSEYIAPAEEWSSIISLAHRWQFEHIREAAFKGYAALLNVSPAAKIAMSHKYDFPRKHLVDIYLEICQRDQPVSVKEGDCLRVEAVALITQT
jgi:hypothetical protein